MELIITIVIVVGKCSTHKATLYITSNREILKTVQKQIKIQPVMRYAFVEIVLRVVLVCFKITHLV